MSGRCRASLTAQHDPVHQYQRLRSARVGRERWSERVSEGVGGERASPAEGGGAESAATLVAAQASARAYDSSRPRNLQQPT
eukprot:2462846-Rhodomonas_salina.1